MAITDCKNSFFSLNNGNVLQKFFAFFQKSGKVGALLVVVGRGTLGSGRDKVYMAVPVIAHRFGND